jgi:hypothetical protein
MAPIAAARIELVRRAGHVFARLTGFQSGAVNISQRITAGGSTITQTHSARTYVHRPESAANAEEPGATTPGRSHLSGRAAMTSAEDLIYELLDAHSDTAKLADASELDDSWAAHLDYLRALQRTGRETLAQIAEERS